MLERKEEGKQSGQVTAWCRENGESLHRGLVEGGLLSYFVYLDLVC